MLLFGILVCIFSITTLLGAFLLVRNRLGRGPATAKSRSVEIVADLDAIVTRTVGVTLQGKMHRIAPVPLERFFEVLSAWGKIDTLRATKETVTTEQLIEAYLEFFSRMCPTITRAHIEGMTHQQIGRLMDVMIAQIMGKPMFEAEKKSGLTPTEEKRPETRAS